jgi:hypothetical protein
VYQLIPVMTGLSTSASRAFSMPNACWYDEIHPSWIGAAAPASGGQIFRAPRMGVNLNDLVRR